MVIPSLNLDSLTCSVFGLAIPQCHESSLFLSWSPLIPKYWTPIFVNLHCQNSLWYHTPWDLYTTGIYTAALAYTWIGRYSSEKAVPVSELTTLSFLFLLDLGPWILCRLVNPPLLPNGHSFHIFSSFPSYYQKEGWNELSICHERKQNSLFSIDIWHTLILNTNIHDFLTYIYTCLATLQRIYRTFLDTPLCLFLRLYLPSDDYNSDSYNHWLVCLGLIHI